MKLIAYTDGSNTYNGFEYSYGGYGWVLFISGEDHLKIEGGASMPVCVDDPVTNNKAEILGVVSVLEYAYNNFFNEVTHIDVYTDSALTVNCANRKWKAKKNLDLFARLFKVRNILTKSGCEVNIKWVKGHAGDTHNERADELANFYSNLVKQERNNRVTNTEI